MCARAKGSEKGAYICESLYRCRVCVSGVGPRAARGARAAGPPPGARGTGTWQRAARVAREVEARSTHVSENPQETKQAQQADTENDDAVSACHMRDAWCLVSERLGRRVVEASLSRVTALQPCCIYRRWGSGV